MLSRAPPHHTQTAPCVCVCARVSFWGADDVRLPWLAENLLGVLATSEERWAQRMAARAWAILSLVVGALLIIVAMLGTKCLGAVVDSAAENASKSTSKNKSTRWVLRPLKTNHNSKLAKDGCKPISAQFA